MAAEYVQPVPCVWRVAVLGALKSVKKPSWYSISTVSVANSSPSRWPPLISTDLAPDRAIRQAASFMSSRWRTGTPDSSAASGTLGVKRAAFGIRRSRSAVQASASSNSVPCLPIMTGSTTSRAVPHTVGDSRNDRCGAQSTGLGGVRWQVLKNGVDLFGHQPGIKRLNARQAGGVLDGEQSDRGGAIDPELVERFEVGLNARSSAGVRAGDGEGNRDHVRSIHYGRRMYCG